MRMKNCLIVPREVTQAKLDHRAQAGQRHRASQTYTLAERFEESTIRYAERPCLRYGDTCLSYAQTNASINQVAHAGHQLGLRCGDVVALCMENRPGFMFVWLGLAKLGVTAVFLNTNVRGKLLEHGLSETGAKLVVVGEECLPQFAATALPADVSCWLWPDEERPASAQELPIRVIVPAFMIGELKRAFEIGFLLFVPFLVIDLVVASVLMSMGMMMLPPVVVSLPFKLIFFVLVDGWRLVAGSLVESFHQVAAAAPG